MPPSETQQSYSYLLRKVEIVASEEGKFDVKSLSKLQKDVACPMISPLMRRLEEMIVVHLAPSPPNLRIV